MRRSKSELVDLSIDRFMVGELALLEMFWFWLWLWLGVQRDECLDAFWDSEQICAYSEARSNPVASMNSGPWDAYDWDEWVVAFPTIGYAIREVSNY